MPEITQHATGTTQQNISPVVGKQRPKYERIAILHQYGQNVVAGQEKRRLRDGPGGVRIGGRH